MKVLQETEDEIYGCDINDYPVGMDKVRFYWKSDLAIKPEYVPALIQKCKEIGITHLIPVNEEEIQAIDKHMEDFHAAGIKVMINNPYILENFLDKYKTYECLSKIEGITVPKTYRYEEFVEDGKTYLVKLRQSCGSKFLHVITKRQELDELNVEKDKCVIQEYLDNAQEEYTAGVFSNGKKTEVIVFRRKLMHGYTSFVEFVQDPPLEREAAAIAKKIGLKGYINIQFRKCKGKNYIFEINPRVSGTVVFRHMLGFEDVIWWLEILDHKSVPEFRCKYKMAIGMRELQEKFVILR